MNAIPGAQAGTLPVDVEMMRESTSRLIGPDTASLEGEKLAWLTSLMRGHIQLIIPEIEQAAGKLPEDDVPRYCALACIGEARAKLRTTADAGPHRAAAHARKLARSLMALCDHYEALTGVAMCLVCDKPIRDGEDSVPYSQVSSSGGAACAGRIHAQCSRIGRRRRR
ncbi:DUF6415 family natural product biosynthesis protein [Streptomyces sp. NPDC046931]|uniref:DUF6415 family natural product biosynthesis protein n=1 Tax=Streptomyces sp. NPDC046931 TaxID=3154806 RepID=UPI0033F76640